MKEIFLTSKELMRLTKTVNSDNCDVVFFQKIPKHLLDEHEEEIFYDLKNNYGIDINSDMVVYDDDYEGFEKGYYYIMQRGPLKQLIAFMQIKDIVDNIIIAMIEDKKENVRYCNKKY